MAAQVRNAQMSSLQFFFVFFFLLSIRGLRTYDRYTLYIRMNVTARKRDIHAQVQSKTRYKYDFFGTNFFSRTQKNIPYSDTNTSIILKANMELIFSCAMHAATNSDLVIFPSESTSISLKAKSASVS